MINNIPPRVEEHLAADPCLPFLGKKFVCIDDTFRDVELVADTFGCAPLRRREYTLIEIRFTTSGWVGNFRELPPSDHRAGFPLSRFVPRKGFHPERLLRTEAVVEITRAKFALDEYRPSGFEVSRYGAILRPGDQVPVNVFNFEPRLLGESIGKPQTL